MKPIAKVEQNCVDGYTDVVHWTAWIPPAGTELFTASQLRQAKVEVLREAITRWVVTGKIHTGYEQVVRVDELIRMADEIENGE